MPTKTACRDYNELLPGADKPRPRERSKGGGAMLHCFREEEEKTRGAFLSLSLSLNNKLFHLYTYFHTAMRSVKHVCTCGCYAVLKL